MIAYTRPVPASINECELTHLARRPIDLGRARAEHARYEEALAIAGAEVQRLPAADSLPDSVFVEDTAIVLDDVAVIARPGAASRRPEVDAVREALARHRPLAELRGPATLDGGDVLVLDRRIVVGLTARTTQAGVDALRSVLAPRGYRVDALEVRGCLHLKSAVTRAGAGALVLNPNWVDGAAFSDWDCIAVDPAEPHAGNVLWLGDWLIMPDAHPRTADRLAARNLATLLPVPASELALAEGGVTCGSLIVRET